MPGHGDRNFQHAGLRVGADEPPLPLEPRLLRELPLESPAVTPSTASSVASRSPASRTAVSRPPLRPSTRHRPEGPHPGAESRPPVSAAATSTSTRVNPGRLRLAVGGLQSGPHRSSELPALGVCDRGHRSAPPRRQRSGPSGGNRSLCRSPRSGCQAPGVVPDLQAPPPDAPASGQACERGEAAGSTRRRLRTDCAGPPIGAGTVAPAPSAAPTAVLSTTAAWRRLTFERQLDRRLPRDRLLPSKARAGRHPVGRLARSPWRPAPCSAGTTAAATMASADQHHHQLDQREAASDLGFRILHVGFSGKVKASAI